MPIQLGMGSPVQKPLATSTTTRTIIRRRVINRTSQRASEGDSYEAGNDRASIGRLELARFMAIPNRISVLRDRLEDEVQANIGRGELQLELDRKRTQIQSLRQAKEEYLSHWKYVRALFRDSISKNYGLGDWVASEGGTHSKTLDDRIAGLLAEVGKLESDLAEKRGKIRKAGLQLLALNPLDSNRLENELRQLTLQEEPKFEIRKRIFILEKKAHFIQIKSAQMAAEGIDWGRTASSLLFQDAIAQIEEAHRKLDTCLAAYHQYEYQVGSLNPYEPNFSQKYDDYVQQLLESSKTVPNLLAVHKNGFLRVLAAKKREHDWILARRNGAKQIAREALSRLSSLEGYQELRNEASIRVVLSRFQERFDAILTQESFITNEQLASLTPALLCPKINEAIRAIWAEIDEHDSSIFATAVVLGADNQSTLSRLENALQHMPELEQFRERALGARP
ncbi:MAG: hypothetical protein JKY15_03430 [Deltaproteobacteria bacterium]|nr:hypothetical protein [Deltaproteobacteria bacterium]